MRRSLYFIKLVVGTFLLFSALTTQANAYSRCDSIPQGINYLMSRMNPSVRVGVVVQSMQSGRVYFSKNANQIFAPASVQKIFTVSSALINLTPDFRFTTRLFSTGSINQGDVHGNVVVQFSGDPTLKQNDLADLIGKLKAQGVQRIQGNFVLDDTAFNHVPYPAGWLWNDLSSDFAAPLNTIILNRNQFGLSLVPTRAGQRPQIIPRLPPGAATFINEATTTNHPKRNCPISILSNEENQYLIRGCLARSQGKQSRSLAIRNTEMFTKSLVAEQLSQNGIALSGHIVFQKTPPNAELIAEHSSKPLKQVIVHLLKKSDNLYADALYKKIGEYYDHAPGSWVNGALAEAPILSNDVGINANQFHFVDGAGLSRYNYVTPYAVSRMLNYIEHRGALRDNLIPALPIAGVDGTLIYRMPTLARGERVHAKTGSMTGVSTLAGFVQTRSHGLLSFVIMINNVPKNRYPSILLENNIVEFLANAGNC